jgi:hypothetical protein
VLQLATIDEKQAFCLQAPKERLADPFGGGCVMSASRSLKGGIHTGWSAQTECFGKAYGVRSLHRG